MSTLERNLEELLAQAEANASSSNSDTSSAALKDGNATQGK